MKARRSIFSRPLFRPLPFSVCRTCNQVFHLEPELHPVWHCPVCDAHHGRDTFACDECHKYARHISEAFPIPAPAPVDTGNDAGDPKCLGEPVDAIDEPGAGAGLPSAGALREAMNVGLIDREAAERLVSNNQPRDPGAPKPCPTCNPSGTSATAGWVR